MKHPIIDLDNITSDDYALILADLLDGMDTDELCDMMSLDYDRAEALKNAVSRDSDRIAPDSKNLAPLYFQSSQISREDFVRNINQ